MATVVQRESWTEIKASYSMKVLERLSLSRFIIKLPGEQSNRSGGRLEEFFSEDYVCVGYTIDYLNYAT